MRLERNYGKRNCQCLDPFYQNLVNIWAEIKSCSLILSKEDVQKECIWNNHYIKINKHAINWQQWNVKGINTIKDLLSPEGTFLSDAEMKNEYGIKTNFLQMYSLRMAIPFTWRNLLKGNDNTDTDVDWKLYFKLNAKSLHKNYVKYSNKELYWSILYLNDKTKESPVSEKNG